jgi:hypothetical protein
VIAYSSFSNKPANKFPFSFQSAKIVAIMGIICEVAEMALWIVASFIKLTFAGTTIGGMWVLVEDSLHPKFTYGPAVVSIL